MESGPDQPVAGHPFHVLVKPIGPICNLSCDYCFYLEKEELYPNVGDFRMSRETLETFVREYLQSQPEGAPEINFAWQGGEPTLLGVEFFREVIELQEQYRRAGDRITNSIQTNGVLLDDEWGAFLAEHHFLVGLSIDGPEELHNRYRRDRKGGGSFQSVMGGLAFLQKHEVEFNTLTVVQADNGDHPEEVYDFLKEIGSRYFQFIPIVEPCGNGGVSERTVGPERYGRFLARTFDRWLEEEDVGEVFIRDFDMLLGLVMGQPSSVCVHAETCGQAMAMEHNGDLYSCDHFVTREDFLGNIAERPLVEVVNGEQQVRFGQDKRDTLPRYCRECRFLEYCHGGCPKDRICKTPDGEPGLNYLCAGYQHFYAHSLPVMEQMAKCLRVGRPARDYQDIETLIQDEVRTQGIPVGRNDPCPCGSGRKYKKCCGRERV
ncbi:MAG: anaerobic sulfatase maturase [Fidelibacterota bacterium]|nr:MAG: anaerobic sulfatase maturase [Candidatus Neomarinimicrobiota bacterium]